MNALARTGPMTRQEAAGCLEKIREGLDGTRRALLDLYRREGWRALGYESWRACVVAEFGGSQSAAYRELKAAQIEVEISPFGESGTLPESHARELARADPADRPAVAAAAGKDATAARLRELVDKANLPADPAAQRAAVEADQRRLREEDAQEEAREARGVLLYRVRKLCDRLRNLMAGLGPESEGPLALLDRLAEVVRNLG